MKKIILLMPIIFLCISSQAFAKEWYEGGTLHHAPVSEWLQADPANVFATTSDLVTFTISDDIIHTLTMDDLKEASDQVAACIYTETVEPATFDVHGSEIATLCMTQLKQNFPWLLTKTK